MKLVLIKPEETEIIGKWLFVNNEMIGDESCLRVRELVEKHLEYVAKDSSGWEKLYRDPNDGRFWHHTYLEGYRHGGGPPSLLLIGADEIKETFPDMVLD